MSLDLNLGTVGDTSTSSLNSLDSASSYVFHLATLGGNFSPPIFSTDSLLDTVINLTIGSLDTLLGSLGILAGDSIDLLWTEADSGSIFVDTIFAISFTRFLTTSTKLPEPYSLHFYPNSLMIAYLFGDRHFIDFTYCEKTYGKRTDICTKKGEGKDCKQLSLSPTIIMDT
ncbi:MAG: hypothetical protein MRZ79_16365 [Bacteroidia bacterium]|nr:hypothetical protein [Bacteroidia bacterium]